MCLCLAARAGSGAAVAADEFRYGCSHASHVLSFHHCPTLQICNTLSFDNRKKKIYTFPPSVLRSYMDIPHPHWVSSIFMLKLNISEQVLLAAFSSFKSHLKWRLRTTRPVIVNFFCALYLILYPFICMSCGGLFYSTVDFHVVISCLMVHCLMLCYCFYLTCC